MAKVRTRVVKSSKSLDFKIKKVPNKPTENFSETNNFGFRQFVHVAMVFVMVFSMVGNVAFAVVPNPNWAGVNWITPSQCSADPAEPPSDHRDLIGTIANPAVAFGEDANYFYFRERLNGNPMKNATEWKEHSWVVLNQTTLPAYQYLLALNGGSNTVEIWQNTPASTAVDFSPIFNDPADGTPAWSGAASTYATATSLGGGIYFANWAIPKAQLIGSGITIETAKYFATSANSNNYNKDFLNCYQAITDLGIVKTVNDSTPAEGQTIVYSLSVTNNGPDSATNVVVNDTLPSGVTYVSSTASQGSYASGVWTIGALANGASVTLNITVTVNSGTATQIIANTGSVDGTEFDNNSNNDSDSENITVDALPPVQHDLTVNTTGSGTGSVSGSGIACPTDCSETYNEGTEVTLTATPDTGSTFVGWSGAGCSGTGLCQVTMNEAKSVTATFNIESFVLDVSKNGTGTGNVVADSGSLDCGSTCSDSYNYNTVVTLTATPDSGSTFGGWAGACSGVSTTCQVTMDAAKSVVATFNIIPPPNNYTLTVSITGTGSGAVNSTDTEIACITGGGDCIQVYVDGTEVTLSAVSNTGSTFVGFSGAGCSGTGACVVTMNDDKNVTAEFSLNNYPLTVALSGNGSGTVGSNIAGISCESDCSENYDYGTSVTLTAVASVGSTFTGWSGDCTGTAVTCDVNMESAKSVTANFVLNTYPLTVSLAGAGSGKVVSDLGSIDCGSTCSDSYNYNTVVTLTATADSGSSFDGFSGACSGTGTCVVTMDQAQNVVATFSIIPPNMYALTVTLAGTGTGTVVSNVNGIDCGSDCNESYVDGTVVELSATAESGSTFTGWSGDCSGTGACSVTLSQAKNVIATFDIVRVSNFTLTLTKNGDGNGTVTGSEGEGTSTFCELDQCDPSKEQSPFVKTYASGTVVTLTASPAEGSNFDNSWSGACTGNNPVCVITMTGNMTVNAHFALNPVTPPCTSNCGGGGGGGGGGGSGGGGGLPVPPAPTGQVLSAISVPSISMPPTPQVLGATTLPRTGMPFGFIFLVLATTLALVDKKFKLI